MPAYEINSSIDEICDQFRARRPSIYRDLPVLRAEPMRELPVVISGLNNRPMTTWMRWGLTDDGLAYARFDLLESRALFSDLIRAHRCIVPATGIWTANRHAPQWKFQQPGGTLFGLAGIWTEFECEFGECCAFAIITVNASRIASRFQTRMPLVLDGHGCLWLQHIGGEWDCLRTMCTPFTPMEAVRSDAPELSWLA